MNLSQLRDLGLKLGAPGLGGLGHGGLGGLLSGQRQLRGQGLVVRPERRLGGRGAGLGGGEGLGGAGLGGLAGLGGAGLGSLAGGAAGLGLGGLVSERQQQRGGPGL